MSQRNWKTSNRRRARHHHSSSTTASSSNPASSSSSAADAINGLLGSIDETSAGGAAGGGAFISGLDKLREEEVGGGKDDAPSGGGGGGGKAQRPQSSSSSSSSPFSSSFLPPTTSATSAGRDAAAAISSRPSVDRSAAAMGGKDDDDGDESNRDDDDDDDDDQDDDQEEDDDGDIDDALTTASTAVVTEATEYRMATGPTIYTGRRQGDNDDGDDDEYDAVSQITSSLAGNTLSTYGSSYYFGGGGKNTKPRRRSNEGGRGGGASQSQSVAGGGGGGASEALEGLDYILAGTASSGGGGGSGARAPQAAAHDSHNAASIAASTVRTRDSGGSGDNGKLDSVDVSAYVGSSSNGMSGTATTTGKGGMYTARLRTSGTASASVSGAGGRGGGGGGGVLPNGRTRSRYVPSRTMSSSSSSSPPPPSRSPLTELWGHLTHLPAYVHARRVCCTLRRSLLPFVPAYVLSCPSSPSNRRKKDDGGSGDEIDFDDNGVGQRGDGDDDYYSRIMSPNFARPKVSGSLGGASMMNPAQRRQQLIVTGLRLLVLVALAMVGLLVLKEAMLGGGDGSGQGGLGGAGEYYPQGPEGMVGPDGRGAVNGRDGGGGGGGGGGAVRGGMHAHYRQHHMGGDRATAGVGAGGGGAANDALLAQEGLEVPNANLRRPGTAADGGRNDDDAGGAAEALPDRPGHFGIDLPPQFNNLADVDDVPVHNHDLPFYWHIPRSAGGTMNDVLGMCLKLTLASDAGGRQGHDKDGMLKEVEFPSKIKYANVDTSTAEGIARAKKLGLAESGLSDVFVTTLLYDGTSVFSDLNRGRMFTMFRHPVERAVSLFHFVQDTVWRRQATYVKELSTITIEEYYKGGMGENNWMVRFLANEHKAELDDGHLSVAKEIIRRKCLVGLLSEKGESFARFEAYFGWPVRTEEERECHDKKLQWAWPLKHRHDDVEERSELWELIVEHNKFDVQLYEYAQQLFREQGKMFEQ